MLVMMAVVGSPPEWAALCGAGAEKGKDELPEAVGRKGLVREIPVIEAGYRKHTEDEEAQGKPGSKRAHADPDNAETRKVQGDEGENP